MKVFNFKNLLLLFFVGLLTACSSSKNSSDYESSIPVEGKDLIVSFRLDQLIEKSDILNLIKKEEYQDIYQTIQATSTDLFSIISFLKEPKENGLNLKKPIYLLSSSQTKENYLFSLPLEDASKLRKLLDNTAELSKQSYKIGDFEYYTLDTETVQILINSSALLIVYNKGEQITDDFLTDNTLDKQCYFAQLKENDITVALNTKSFSKKALDIPQVMKFYSDLYASTYDKLTGDMYQVIGVNFEPSKLTVKQEIHLSNQEDQELLNSWLKTYKPIKNSFATDLNKDPLLYFNVGLDGQKIAQLLAKLIDENIDTDSKELDIERIISNIDGELLVSLSDLEIGFFKQSLNLNVFVPTKDKYAFDQLIALLKSSRGIANSIVEETPNCVTLNQLGIDFYFGRKDNYIYLTTEKRITEDPIPELDSSMADSRYYKDIKGLTGYYVIDLQQLINNNFLKNYILQFVKEGAIKDFIFNLDYFEMKTNKDFKTDIVITQKDSKDNFLKTFTTAALELSKM